MPRTLAMTLTAILSLGLLVSVVSFGPAQKRKSDAIPHGQDAPPGPALTPAEAVKKMKVPEGFSVEIVAAEPDLINPVAMTFDEKGRVWVTESVEYPRRSAGPGKDRVKIIDIGPDGKASKVTVFAEGLNIPSGIAVGHGGVWVANSPDILFYKIGPDGKAAGKPEVVVTGFGRDDTHELPNSLTWGPDGWLYGWNGVFNSSHVKQNGKEWRFTCAIFRIHPKTREFQLFCEGTSNPWGIAIDPEGSLFASACVIDHLWHLTETGYYHRQGGPYPPFTWPISSIVRHRHQKAAYCGIHYFDSDAYPKKYRDRLYMGNIHGGCINVDTIQRDGATYAGTSAPDFLTANDQWFMPVAQKTGPDGCLYILDWYDRYHCYQDANRDPAGIDRKNGRLYRVRYKETARAGTFDLARESDGDLVQRLTSPNVYFRDIAQRLLTERLLTSKAGDSRVPGMLTKVIFDDKADRKMRLHALFALAGGEGINDAVLLKLLNHADTGLRAWGVRTAGSRGKVGRAVCDRVMALAKDRSPEVLLQVAIAARKINTMDAMAVFVEVLSGAGGDRLIPPIVWQNLHPLLEERAEAFVKAIKANAKSEPLGEILPRAIDRILASKKPQTGAMVELYELVREGKQAQQILAALTGRIRNGEISPATTAELKNRLLPRLAGELKDEAKSNRLDIAALLCAFKHPQGIEEMRRLLVRTKEPEAVRMLALEALAFAKDGAVLHAAEKWLGDASASFAGRAAVLAALGKLEDNKVAEVVLTAYSTLPVDIRPRAIELLTQRDAWSKALLEVIAAKKLPAGVLNVNQARRLLTSKDKALVALVKSHWGTLRDQRNPAREKVVEEMKRFLTKTKGDPKKGIIVYKGLCGQCHKIYGEGVEVGPDITSNGRASFEQLLSNVFDPSLVIGPGYHAVTVETTRGRSLTGLLVEESPARIVLKVQGGKQEVVARNNIEKVQVSKLSMMPEGVEKQLKPGEMADLFAFLTLDRHPDDPKARRIPGTPSGLFGGR